MDQTFTSILDFCFSLWNIITVGATFLWRFFGSPVDEDITAFLDIPPETTYVELMFGGILMFVLITLLIKAFTSFFPAP